MPAEQMPTIPPPPKPIGVDDMTPARLQLVGGTSTAAGESPTPDARSLRVLWVRPWDDPKLAGRGHDPRSAYVERFWVAVLGPSAVLTVRQHLPSVPRRLHDRIPQELRDEVGRWFLTDGHTDLSVGETRLLASCMVMLGHGLRESAERIIALGVAPDAANEATAWAWAQQCTRPPSSQRR